MTRVIGACIEVHRHLGPGFLESIYQRAVCIELQTRGIPFRSEESVDIVYKQHTVHRSRIDLMVDSKVIVEVKAVSQLEEIHGSQLVSYLRATGLRAGLLANFNCVTMKAGLRRVVR